MLPGLYEVYEKKLRPAAEKFWLMKVQCATTDRIKLSQRPDYDEKRKNQALGPWDEWSIQMDIDAWNEDIMDKAMNGDE